MTTKLAENSDVLPLASVAVATMRLPATAPPLGTMAVGVALSAVAVVVPLLGARRLLTERKYEELARVRLAIEGRTEDGWYPIGTITVEDGPFPVGVERDLDTP